MISWVRRQDRGQEVQDSSRRTCKSLLTARKESFPAYTHTPLVPLKDKVGMLLLPCRNIDKVCFTQGNCISLVDSG